MIAILCPATEVAGAIGVAPTCLALAGAAVIAVRVPGLSMVTAVRVCTLDVDSAVASTPTSIAGARASIICIVIPGVSVVAAVTTMARWRRRRWRRIALARQGCIQDSLRFC